MENKSHAMAAGIFVLAVTALLVMLAAWLTRDTGQRDIYEISTREPVTGLQSQAPVRLRGVDVGKVLTMEFDPKALGNVLIRLEIDHNAPVTQATFAVLGFQGVTGLAFVQLDDAGQQAARLVPQDDRPPRIPLRSGLVSRLLARGDAILEQAEQAGARVNQLLADPNQQRLASALEKVGQAASDVSKLSTQMTAILNAQMGPERVNLPAFFKNADATLNALRGTSDEAKAATMEIATTVRRLNDKDGPVDRLAQGAQALSHAADAFNASTLPRLNRMSEDSSRAVRQLGRAASAINDNPQSLIFGHGVPPPGPGEPGFAAPGVSR